ncbi:MAG: GNAT family N-acetyltransferase [Rhodoblastus sp.]
MNFSRATEKDFAALHALQSAAYAGNARILGATPIPLQADYARILCEKEVWLAGAPDDPAGALILEFRPGHRAGRSRALQPAQAPHDDAELRPDTGDMLIWSVATHPRTRGAGLGRALLAFAEKRARQEGRPVIRLYTASVYLSNIEWYARHGFEEESRETLADRTMVNMIKKLD